MTPPTVTCVNVMAPTLRTQPPRPVVSVSIPSHHLSYPFCILKTRYGSVPPYLPNVTYQQLFSLLF